MNILKLGIGEMLWYLSLRKAKLYYNEVKLSWACETLGNFIQGNLSK